MNKNHTFFRNISDGGSSSLGSSKNSDSEFLDVRVTENLEKENSGNNLTEIIKVPLIYKEKLTD